MNGFTVIQIHTTNKHENQKNKICLSPTHTLSFLLGLSTKHEKQTLLHIANLNVKTIHLQTHPNSILKVYTQISDTRSVQLIPQSYSWSAAFLYCLILNLLIIFTWHVFFIFLISQCVHLNLSQDKFILTWLLSALNNSCWRVIHKLDWSF